MENRYKNHEIPKKQTNSDLISQYYKEIEADKKAKSEQANKPENATTNAILTDTEFVECYGNEAIDLIYEWYANAMIKRKGSDGLPREPLHEDNFKNHFFEGGYNSHTLIYGNQEDGYLLGKSFGSFFQATHFAPKTLKGGYRLLKKLGDDKKILAILTITEDLIRTLKKLDTWYVSSDAIPGLTGKFNENKFLALNNLNAAQENVDELIDYCIANIGFASGNMVEMFVRNILNKMSKTTITKNNEPV
jgi:hypothetical protein